MHKTFAKTYASSQKGGIIKIAACNGFRKLTKRQRKLKLATHSRTTSVVNGKKVTVWTEHKDNARDLIMNRGAGLILGLISSVTMTPEQC